MLKRVFALLLAFLMVFSAVPAEALASTIQDGNTSDSIVVTTADDKAKTDKAGAEKSTSETESVLSDNPEKNSEEKISEEETTEVETTEEETTEVETTEEETTEVETTEETTEVETTEEETTEVETTEEETTEVETTEEETTEEEPAQETEPEEEEQETVSYNLGWEYAVVDLTADGYAFTNPDENHLGSQVSVTVGGVSLSEGALLSGIISEGTYANAVITAAEGYVISDVALASVDGTPFAGTIEWTADARGFMTDASGEKMAVISLAEVYNYMIDGDAANVYLMVELAQVLTMEESDSSAAMLAPGRPGGPGGGTGSYGSHLGWYSASISENSSGGFDLKDTQNLGSYITVSVSSGAVTSSGVSLAGTIPEGNTSLRQNAIASGSTGIVTVTSAYPYYVAEVVLACGHNTETEPFECNTVAGDNGYGFVLPTSTPTHLEFNLQDIRTHANHMSGADNYYLMIELAKVPDTVYVGYDAGTAGSTKITAVPVAETGTLSDGGAQVSSYKTWSYAAGETAAPVHTALNISPEAEAEANALGYSFAGWHLEYYTGYTPNTFSGDMTVGGTNLTAGTGVTLTVNAKLTAIWVAKQIIQVTKVWEDNNDQDGLRPDDVVVHLLKNDAHVGHTVTLNQDNSWQGYWTVPSVDVNGAGITYTVQEEVPSGYTASVSGSEESGFVVTNTHTPETTVVNVEKIWNDDHDRDGIRPDSIVLHLLANGEDTNKTATLNSTNQWVAQWDNLTKYENGEEIVYTVVETSVPDGYEVSYDVDTDTGVLQVINTHTPEMVTVTANKAWIDNNDQDGLRPDSVVLTIFADGVSTGETITVTADGGWTASKQMPKYRNGGTEIIYTLVEEAANIPAGYEAKAEGTTVTNTHTPATLEIPVTKNWDDNDDQDGLRPGSVQVKLLADGTEVEGKTLTLYASENWSGKFADLPVYADGKQIVYTIEEVPVEGYTTAITGSVAEGYTITNTHEIEKTSLTVQKVWEDFEDNDGKRPESVTVALRVNGVADPDNTVILSESNSWTGSWDDLDKYAGGVEIVYSAVEIGNTKDGSYADGLPEGYYVEHQPGTDEQGNPVLRIVNTYALETTGLDVQKIWDDKDNQDGLRPASVTVTLLHKTSENGSWETVKNADGKIVTGELNPANEWDYSFTGLPKYHGGYEIIYNVMEEAVEGYDEPKYAFDERGAVIITNSRTPEVTALTVRKVWDDANDQDGLRPGSVKVSLYGINKQTPIETVELSDATGWIHTWSNLPANYAGNKIVYTIVEEAVSGYNVNASGEAQNVIVSADKENHTVSITNVRTPATTAVSFAKVWEDAGNQDGIRPAAVTVTLYANGTAVQSKTVSAADNWRGTFTDLPVNKDGKAIIYTVGEETVSEGYSASVSGTTITNTHIPAEIDIPVTKIWEDNDNQDGKRPGSITVILYADNVQADTLTLNQANGWKGTFENLPKYADGNEINYTIRESGEVPGYTASINGTTITNSYTPESTAVTATKVWDDAGNQDGKRPASVTISLLADDVKVDSKTADEASGWSVTFAGLPVYKDGEKITYTVAEENVPAGYKASVDGTTITNSYTPEKTSVTVNKIWADNNNQDGKRPASVNVTLFANGEAVKTAEVTGTGNEWKHTFTDLAKFADGMEIIYTAAETQVPAGYTSSAEGTTITNTYTPEVTSVVAHKVWDDANDQDGKRPDSITINLLADNAWVKSQTVNAASGWRVLFDNLPVYKDGEEIVYTVTENPVSGYEASVDGTTITNSYTPATTSVTATKIWNDNMNQDGKRPDSVVLTIYADDVSTGKTVTVTAGNDWKGTVSGLPKYRDGGIEIVYTVEEDTANVPAGYTASASGTTVTNTYTPETLEIPVTKVWNDANDQDGLRPDEISVSVYNGTNKVQTITLKASENWTGKFTGLPVYENGKKIVYTVAEAEVAGYTSAVSGSVAAGFTVTNTHEPETVKIIVNKVWNDGDNQDGKRPESIKLHLVASGDHYFQEPVVVTAADNWTVEWDNLPKYHDGQPIVYVVTENDVYNTDEVNRQKYSAEYSETVDDVNNVTTVTITNTLEPGKTSVTVEKIWRDTYNQDGLRPASIRVQLYANGVATGQYLTLTAEHGWVGTFTHLDEYVDGVEIKYTVKEVTVPDGYEVEYTEDNITGNLEIRNTHEVAKTSVSVKKVWDDNNDQDGIRPDSVMVTLYRNGIAYDEAELNESNQWSYTFEGLDVHHGIAVDNIYTVKESGVPAGYNVAITGSADEGYVITNAHTPETVDIPVTKQWQDSNDQDGYRPDKITVILLADGQKVGTQDLTAADNWMGSFKGLPKYADGKQIVYTLDEVTVDQYTTDIDGYTITNSHTPETINIPVKKVWNDNDDQDGVRPDSVTVTLFANGKSISRNIILLESSDWSGEFTNLPKYADGKLIDYTVNEVITELAGLNYVSTVDTVDGVEVITNTRSADKTSVIVQKNWDDNNDQDGIRPASIQVRLLADGTVADTVTLNDANGWRHTWNGLDLRKNGQKIEYTVEEVGSINGYKSISVYDATYGIHTITNTHEPAVTAINAKKVWDDNKNQDGKRPAAVTLTVYADGVSTGKTVTVTEADKWEATVSDLPKYRNGGVEIVYSMVEEAVPDGYTSVTEGTTVTNSYTPETTSITARKIWNDAHDQDGKRPDSVELTILANGVSTGKTVMVTVENGWTATVSGLPKYKDGDEIVYSLVEKNVPDYYTSISNGTTVTNSYTPETTSIIATKVWSDNNDQDGIRPDSVVLTVYADGVSTGKTVTVKESEGWKATVSDLPRYRDGGIEIVYSMVEEIVPDGYTAETNGTVVTNTHTPDVVSVPVFKRWNDNTNQDGIRPKSIEVNLMYKMSAEEQWKAVLDEDGKPVSETLTASIGWRHTFSGLPKNAGGKTIIYGVEEAEVPVGYQVSYPVENGVYIVENTHTPAVVSLNVEKVWNDFDDNDGARPFEVVIELYANGQPMTPRRTVTLSKEENGWKGSFPDMPRFHNGQRISYSVMEVGHYQTEDAEYVAKVPDGYMVDHSYVISEPDANGNVKGTATVTNIYTPKTTALNVQKIWDDDNNREGNRPDDITVTLMHQTEENGAWEVVENDGKEVTAVLNAANRWEADFTGLPKIKDGFEILYNVVEEDVTGLGYGAPVYKLNTKTMVVTVTNPYEISYVDVAVNKVWDDEDNQDGKRPKSIDVTLYANGIATSETATLSETNNWSHTWEDLYGYYKGSKITYTVVEENAVAGYTMSSNTVVTPAEGANNEKVSVTITNSYTPETTSIPVRKIWSDANNQDGIRPASVQMALLANGKEVKTVTLRASGNWRHTFTDLDVYSGGKEIEYSIQEKNVPKDYEDSYTTTNGVLTVTNTHTIYKTELTAVKVWDDNNDQDGKRPESITLHLLANGEHMGESYKRVLSKDNDWTCTWTDLDMYDAGEKITYVVFEDSHAAAVTQPHEPAAQAAEGYTVSYSRVSDTKVVVTNSYIPETTAVSVMKIWNDGDNRDGLRPESVTVALLADGEDTGKNLILSQSNGWAGDWRDLPKYRDHGIKIEYSVEEKDLPLGYDAAVTTEGSTQLLTNTHVPATTGVSVTKVWADEDDNDGKRYDGIIVQLYAVGNPIMGARVILSETNRWTYTWASTPQRPLYVYEKGELIDYSVSEIGCVIDGKIVLFEEGKPLPDGYVGSTSEDGYNVTITNTRATEKISVQLDKVWDDNNDQDGIRPDSVVLTIYADGVSTGKTVELTEAGQWKATVGDLPKYRDGGTEILYTAVEETVPAGYTAVTNGTTVTNTHVPEEEEHTVTKIWVDKKSEEKYRSSSVTIQIYKNGDELFDEIVLTKKDGWKGTVILPVYDDGVEITWTIKEKTIPRYYTASYNQNTFTVTNTIQSHLIPKTGDDSNLGLWVLMLAACGTGAVSVLFYDRKKTRKA